MVLPPHFLQNVVAEAELVAAGALRHHLQQQLLAEDEHIQAAVARRGKHIVGGVRDAARLIQCKVGIRHIAGDGGAYRRHVRAGLDMAAQHILQRQVDDKVAVRQQHIVLPDALEVVHHARQCLHLAPVLAAGAPALVIRKGGQQRQAAVVEAEIPALAGAKMIQHRLALAVHDDAHVRDTGVDHGGQHKVDDPVIPAEGDGAVDAVGDQLPQIRPLLVGEDDPVHSFHGRTSLPLAPSIIFGSTTPPSGTVVRGPSTAMPH